jgi:hypothetical protein
VCRNYLRSSNPKAETKKIAAKVADGLRFIDRERRSDNCGERKDYQEPNR